MIIEGQITRLPACICRQHHLAVVLDARRRVRRAGVVGKTVFEIIQPLAFDSDHCALVCRVCGWDFSGWRRVAIDIIRINGSGGIRIAHRCVIHCNRLWLIN